MDNIITEGEDKLNLSDGYFTRKSFEVANKEAWSSYEKTVTQLVKDTRKIINGRYWYLTTMTLPAGILFPHGPANDHVWVVAPIAALDATEEKTYNTSREAGEFYKSRVAIEGAKQFQEFQEALVFLGMQ